MSAKIVDIEDMKDIKDIKTPKIDILEIDQNKIRIGISNIDLSVVNSLRRIAIAQVETLTIENIVIQDNSCRSCPDPILVNRLALLPLLSDTVSLYNYAENCDCKTEYCKKCGIEFTLTVKNTSQTHSRRVTTKDLRPVDETVRVLPVYTNYESKDDDESILICELQPNEEISLNAIARKGIGLTHRKWEPTGRVGIKRPVTIKIDQEKINKLSLENRKKLETVCCQNVFKYDEKNQILSTVEDPSNCRNCKNIRKCIEFVDSLSQPDAIEIIPNEYFIMTIITNQSLKPEEIFHFAVSNFIKRLKHIYDEIGYS